jgi:ADYC domain-containing protein
MNAKTTTLPSRAPLLLAICVLATLATLGGLTSLAEADVDRSLATVDAAGTELTVALPDGRVLRSPQLVGAVLTLRAGLRVRIEAVEEEKDRRGGSVWLHSFAVQHTDGTWTNLCQPGPDGRRAGFPVPGRARPDGTVAEAGPRVFEVTCTGGAQGKCVRFGYHPWERGPDGRSLRDLYNACIRMVRADYGGDGQGTTRDGTPIDTYDDWKIQTPDMIEGQDFEAAWGPDGAVCVRHVRITENVSLEELERRYPRLRGRTGSACTEELGRTLGAFLFNRSR